MNESVMCILMQTLILKIKNYFINFYFLYYYIAYIMIYHLTSARINLLCEGNLVISRSVEANKDT